MLADGRDVRVQVLGIEGFQGFGDMSMQQVSAHRQERGVHHLAHAVVDQLEPLTDGAEHSPPHQLLDPVRRFVLAEPRRASEQIELELPIDHGGEPRQLAPPLTQPLESRGDQLTHALG